MTRLNLSVTFRPKLLPSVLPDQVNVCRVKQSLCTELPNPLNQEIMEGPLARSGRFLHLCMLLEFKGIISSGLMFPWV